MTKHQGEIIRGAIRRSGFPITKVAKCLKISINTLYIRLKEPELSYEFVTAVSNTIHYNFAIYFPELQAADHEIDEGPINYIDRDTVELLKLGEKYTGLLERYNKLLAILTKLAIINELQTLKEEILKLLEDKPD